jgi:hypothetical protein
MELNEPTSFFNRSRRPARYIVVVSERGHGPRK